MSKITVVANSNTPFNRRWICDICQDYINVVPYSASTVYPIKNTIFYVNTTDVDNPLIDTFLAQGIPVLCDSNWEISDRYLAGKYSDNKLFYIMSNPNWFWYNESLMLNFLGQRNFNPSPNYTKLALLPMARVREHRQLILDELHPVLDECIWSAAWLGKFLPGSGDPLTEWRCQRHLNPSWYNDTCFSIVTESEINFHHGTHIFLTEKTFKPIAHNHPMIVIGQYGILSYLHKLGFETFENIFDESYEFILDPTQRTLAVAEMVKLAEKRPYSKLTVDKLKHNHNLYFNLNLVKQRILDEVIIPLVEYVNKT